MSDRSSHARAMLMVVAVSVPTIFAGLGTPSLWETDEPIYAQASREMLARGDVLTPWFNDEPFFEKPILFYWLQLLVYLALGVSELSARLPAAFAGLGCGLLLYGIGARLAGRATGLMAAASLLTMFRIVAFSRQAMIDMPVLFFVLLAIYGLIGTLQEPARRRDAWLAWIGMALGVLTKGPVGLLPLLIWLPFLWFSGRWDAVRRLHVRSGTALFLGIVCPWYAYMIWRHGPVFLEVSVLLHIVARYTADSFVGPQRGPLYYFEIWPADVAPWTPFFIAGVAVVCLRWSSLADAHQRAALLALTWFVVIQAVFSFSSTKLAHYIIPSYPAVALLVALFFQAAPDLRDRWPRLLLGLASGLLGVTCLALSVSDQPGSLGQM